MAVVKAVMNRRVLQSAGSFFSHLRTGSFSRGTLLNAVIYSFISLVSWLVDWLVGWLVGWLVR